MPEVAVSGSVLGGVGRSVGQIQLRTQPEMDFPPLGSLALMTMIAGYLQEDRIHLAASSSVAPSPDDAEELSAILNDPGHAPRHYRLAIATTPQSVSSHTALAVGPSRHVVCFSGGLDSTITVLRLLELGVQPEALWLDFDQPGVAAERRSVASIAARLGCPLHIVRLDGLQDLMAVHGEPWAHIIPARNLLIVSLAAELVATTLNSVVYLGVPREEYFHHTPGTDKGPRFFQFANRMLGRLENRPRLMSVAAAGTKAEWLSYWQREWAHTSCTPLMTTTCYAGRSCGQCRSCVKRAIAFTAAGSPGEPFEVDPFFSAADTMVDLMHRWEGERRALFVLALRRRGDRLPPELHALLAEHEAWYPPDATLRKIAGFSPGKAMP